VLKISQAKRAIKDSNSFDDLSSEEIFKLKQLLENEVLLSAYQSLVGEGVVSEEEFWETHKDSSLELLR
jgi:hypothetical protein